VERVTDARAITLVCCGLIGTLVADDGLIERSFAEAIATQGVVSGTSAFARRMTQVHQARGKAPADVLRDLFPDNEARAQAAALAFGKALPDAVSRSTVKPLSGAVETLNEIHAAGRAVCLLTSLPRRVVDLVLDAAGLRGQIDIVVSAEDGPRGFPAPDLALTAMLRAGVDAVADVAIVHDTGAGMACGRSSGASVVAGVLTGPHSPARLKAAGATHVLASIADLPGLLERLDAAADGSAQPDNGTSRGRSRPSGSAATRPAPLDVPTQPMASRPRLGR
jgi:phosphoglycolate phosphatase